MAFSTALVWAAVCVSTAFKSRATWASISARRRSTCPTCSVRRASNATITFSSTRPSMSLAELHEGVFVNLCVVFHSSQPFRQGTKVCHFILPRFRGSLCEFHRHAEQETIAKCQRETLEERGLTGLLHKT